MSMSVSALVVEDNREKSDLAKNILIGIDVNTKIVKNLEDATNEITLLLKHHQGLIIIILDGDFPKSGNKLQKEDQNGNNAYKLLERVQKLIQESKATIAIITNSATPGHNDKFLSAISELNHDRIIGGEIDESGGIDGFGKEVDRIIQKYRSTEEKD